MNKGRAVSPPSPGGARGSEAGAGCSCWLLLVCGARAVSAEARRSREKAKTPKSPAEPLRTTGCKLLCSRTARAALSGGDAKELR